MSEYFSTQTTIENRVVSSRIRLWGDRNKDQTVDSGVLTAAFSAAKGVILGKIRPRFGTQVDDWDSDTVPGLIQLISDYLSLYFLASGENAINESVKANYTIAMDMLNMIADGIMDVTDTSDNSDNDTYTVLRQSTYDDSDSEVDPAWE